MKHLFDALDDQTPPSTGAEIGAALAPMVEQMGKQSEQQARLIAALAASIAEAIKAVDSKTVVVHGEQRAPITEWVFDVQRDRDGNMTRVVATAETAPQFKRTGLS